MTREKIDKQRRAYHKTFEGEFAKEVLRDLARFCYVRKTTFDTNAMNMAFKEGRRDVFLRIAGYLDLSIEDIERYI